MSFAAPPNAPLPGGPGIPPPVGGTQLDTPAATPTGGPQDNNFQTSTYSDTKSTTNGKNNVKRINEKSTEDGKKMEPDLPLKVRLLSNKISLIYLAVFFFLFVFVTIFGLCYPIRLQTYSLLCGLYKLREKQSTDSTATGGSSNEVQSGSQVTNHDAEIMLYKALLYRVSFKDATNKDEIKIYKDKFSSYVKDLEAFYKEELKDKYFDNKCKKLLNENKNYNNIVVKDEYDIEKYSRDENAFYSMINPVGSGLHKTYYVFSIIAIIICLVYFVAFIIKMIASQMCKPKAKKILLGLTGICALSIIGRLIIYLSYHLHFDGPSHFLIIMSFVISAIQIVMLGVSGLLLFKNVI
uniref:Integral membrane protein n=1 Tax=Parastrongyloides trichosuri TaxID=131310 RepID=A0A0N4ZQH9_PARTI